MRGGIGRRTAWLLAPVLAAGCAHRAKPPAPSATAPMAPQPRPPAGAAAGLSLPEPDAAGRFATVNSGIGDKEALWHVRSALNVAALGCRQEGALVRNYNQFLTQRKATLATAYASESGHRSGAALDQHMTRLYNFFAQPPAQAEFCHVAGVEAARIVSVPPADLPHHAPGALARLEAPFLDFYRAYAAYRRDLAAWQADPRAARVSLAAAPARAPVIVPEDTGENWRIQIGAFTGRAAAEAAWERARVRAPGLASYKPHYEKVPARPELVRVQLGSASDRAGALRLCAAAAAGGFDCIPLPR